MLTYVVLAHVTVAHVTIAYIIYLFVLVLKVSSGFFWLSTSPFRIVIFAMVCRKIKIWFRSKKKTSENDTTDSVILPQWELDINLEDYMEMGLFAEYLEMG